MTKQEDVSPLDFEGSGSRQIRATALGRGTQGVPDVRRMIESQFHVAFPHRIWVAGEVGVPAVDDDGTLRFAVHPSTGADPFSLPCVVPGGSLSAVRELLHRSHDADVEDVVREGRLARVGGLLRFDAERGSVVLTVSELDPTPTALELADARAAALRAVAEAGLPDLQRTRTPGTAPLELAVVVGVDDPVLASVQEQLAGSRFDVRARVLPVPLGGTDAPVRLAQAVRWAGRDSDVVLLVRQQGRPLGLAWYDAPEVAQAVADVPVPVVAGLGGAGDRTACDAVAYASLPTAQAAVEWVLARLAEAERRLQDLASDVDGAVEAAGARCRQSLAEVEDDVDRRVQEAAPRAEQARRRARLALLAGCGLLAALVVVAAAVTGRPVLLVGLLLPAAVLGGVLLWWQRAGTTKGRRMGQRDEDFTQVLERLRAVRDELGSSSSPERVAVLREQAKELVTRGRQLLDRHLDPSDGQPITEPRTTDASPAAGTADTTETAVRAVRVEPVEPAPDGPEVTRVIGVRPTEPVGDEPAAAPAAAPAPAQGERH